MNQKKEENKPNESDIFDKTQQSAGISSDDFPWQSLLTRTAQTLLVPNFALHSLRSPRQIGE
jgi:hypothetical protein